MATLDEMEISELFKRALAGDQQEYKTFLLSISPMIRGLVHNKLPSFDAAAIEDIVQEVLLAIHSKRHTWQQEKPLLPWLYAIARYKSIDALRTQERGRTTLDVDGDEFDELEAPSANTEEKLDVETAVNSLDGKLAFVVRAVGVEGASIQEVGARLSMSENAVRVAFHRGLKQLVSLRSSLLGEP